MDEKLDIINSILNGSPNRTRERYFIKYHTNIFNEIVDFSINIPDVSFKYKIWHWINNEANYILCYCGNRVSTKMNWRDGYKEYCSNKCSSNDQKVKDKLLNTLESKYGVTHYSKTNEYKDKVKSTCLDKYGVDNFAKTERYITKSKKTYTIKYGVDNYTKTEEYKSKSKNTCIKKYGVDSYTKTDEFKISFRKTILEKYGVEYLKHIEDRDKHIIANDTNYISYIGGKQHIFKCDKSHNFEINTDNYFGRLKNNIPLCTICNPIGESKSIKEKNLLEFISKNYNNEVISGYRDGLEIDIYLPELKLGFEFNGLYWHSERFKDKNYHLDKTNHFRDKDIRIIHIWEDDWNFKKDIIQSQILNIIGKSQSIFARKCYVKEVNTKEARDFLDNNHIQGKVNSIIKLGLYYNDELVSVMTFDSFEGRKTMEDNGYNLNRFCNKIGFTVIGGASKLLKYFIKNYHPKRIISYADRNWSIGNLYQTLGFVNVGGNGPDYKYVVNDKRVHKSRYKKSKLKTTLTESKTMLELGIHRIYDCGKTKYELKNPSI